MYKQSKLIFRNIAFYTLLLMFSFSYAQVGVGNSDPKATIDITASNQAAPSNADGILIPRVDAFPLTPPTAAQQGMLIYLTTPVDEKGFYHWDQPTTRWIRLSSIEKINDLSDGKSDVDGTDDGSSVFIGIEAGENTDSDNRRNVGLGYRALQANITGFGNTALGQVALASSTGNANTAVGAQALHVNTANQSTAVGYQALFKNTTGTFNTATGWSALVNNVTGANNSAFGNGALLSNTNDDNSAFGYSALRLNTVGFGNSAFGSQALNANTSGENNTAVGSTALNKNLDGDKNVAIGNGTLFSNTTGSQNSAVGSLTMTSNKTGNYNSALGYNALSDNTSGESNTAIGQAALLENRTGSNNVAVGNGALRKNRNADDNTAIGRGAMFDTTSGAENTVVGATAGYALTGNNNVFIGREAGRNIRGNANVFIGYNAGFFTAANSTISSTLLINNSNGAIPLIYGDFATNKVGIAKIATTHALEVNGTTEATQFKVSALNAAPATSSSTGAQGEIRVTATYIYICTATDTWKRVQLDATAW